MHIHSTVLSGAGVLDDISYLLEGKHRVLFVSDGNIVRIEGVQRLLKQVQTPVSYTHLTLPTILLV